jgi:hypothetical protein
MNYVGDILGRPDLNFTEGSLFLDQLGKRFN